MNGQELKINPIAVKALKSLQKIELELYEVKQIEERLVNDLNTSPVIVPPERVNLDSQDEKLGLADWAYLGLLVAGIICVVYVLLYFINTWFPNFITGILLKFLNAVVGEVFGEVFELCKAYPIEAVMIIGVCAALLIYERARNHSVREKIKIATEEKNRQIAVYNSNSYNSWQVKQKNCESHLLKIRDCKKNLEAARENMYKNTGIVDKYWNLPAVTSFLYYYEAGITNTMTGYTGAYRLFEEDLKHGEVVRYLSEINAKLDKVITALQDLHRTVSSINGNVQNLVAQMEVSNSVNADIRDSVSNLEYYAAKNYNLNDFMSSYTIYKDIFR